MNHRAIRYALFDFDGTISLIREGWQAIMIPYFAEVLSETPAELGKTKDDPGLTLAAREFVDILTGKATIYQCIRLCEEVEKRGGKPLLPGDYKAEYLRRLRLRIQDRLDSLRSGADPSPYIVTGAIEFIKALRESGVRVYLASGTDHDDVCEEARLLGLSGLFDGGIYGALEDVEGSSKEMCIRRIIDDNNLRDAGASLLGCGDGYVEIENTKDAGGYAIGVATNEGDIGKIDEWKRDRLLRAGADMIIPDFSNYRELMFLVHPV